MRNTIKRLKKALPPFLTVQEYCRLMKRCQASAYHDLKNKPGDRREGRRLHAFCHRRGAG